MKDIIKGRFSVLIPCYNHEKYISDCLESLIEQDYEEIELLICDDCSNDKSVKEIKKYEEKLKKRFKRVVIIENKVNSGIAKTLNHLLELSNGEYIKIIASDDMLEKHFISSVYNIFVNNPEVDVISTNGWFIENAVHIISTKDSLTKVYENRVKNSVFTDAFERLYDSNIIAAPGLVVRSSVYDKVGNYDEGCVVEDWEFSLRMAHEGCIFYLSDEKLFFYRKSGNVKLLENRRIDIFLSGLYIIDKYGKFLSKKQYARRRINYLFSSFDYAKSNNYQNMINLVKKQKVNAQDVINYGLANYIMIVLKRANNNIKQSLKNDKKNI